MVLRNFFLLSTIHVNWKKKLKSRASSTARERMYLLSTSYNNIASTESNV